MEKRIAVYGRAFCTKCDVAKKHLTSKGVDFDYFDVDDRDVMAKMEALGVSALPVIMLDDSTFITGGGIDRIDALIGEM